MRKLLACLILHQQNMRVLHWKTTSTDFDSVHTLLDSYTDRISGDVDAIAEMCIMLGMNPVSFHEVESLLQGSNLEFASLGSSIELNPQQAFTAVGDIFRAIDSAIEDAYKTTSMPNHMVSEVEAIQFWYSKELNYKNRMRLKNN